jgi:hypothetical protein
VVLSCVCTASPRCGPITPNGPDFYSLFGFNEDTGSTGFPWAAFNGDGAGCSIDPSGNFSCSGSKNAVVPVEGGKRQIALAAIESPKNWFEDFGSAQLVGGLATVQLDPTFKQTVNANLEYHVFLTPKRGLQGSVGPPRRPRLLSKYANWVAENSSVKFDYRITSLRKNYEKVCFADHSREFPGSRDGRVRPATK